ncbi:MAG: tRNA dihydrouridine(20/20a) synthase DusA, partial [Rhodobacteraceae bacterium]|nr:tRNA dihydrouridine(20/20a) synthase DusA [Paracoccaceae bacterium]
VGCPSDRVTTGRFGACLMAEPALVGECVATMTAAVQIPITVKTRIGIDDRDDDGILDTLVESVRAAGSRKIIVHARKALLSGLSPKENRQIPPLKYDRVYRLKRAFPDLVVVLNGGVRSLDDAETHLKHVDGVMVGRAAYERPYEMLSDVDRRIFGANSLQPLFEVEVARRYLAYAKDQERLGIQRLAVLRHAIGLFRGQPGSRRWRQAISAANGPAFDWRDMEAILDTMNGGERLAA